MLNLILQLLANKYKSIFGKLIADLAFNKNYEHGAYFNNLIYFIPLKFFSYVKAQISTKAIQ